MKKEKKENTLAPVETLNFRGARFRLSYFSSHELRRIYRRRKRLWYILSGLSLVFILTLISFSESESYHEDLSTNSLILVLAAIFFIIGKLQGRKIKKELKRRKEN